MPTPKSPFDGFDSDTNWILSQFIWTIQVYLIESFCLCLMICNLVLHTYPPLRELPDLDICISQKYPDLTWELLMAFLLYICTFTMIVALLRGQAATAWHLVIQEMTIGIWSLTTVAKVFIVVWYIGVATQAVMYPGKSFKDSVMKL